jgi:hypothetical protein
MADSFGDSLDSFFTGTADPAADPNIGKASAIDQVQNQDGSVTTYYSDGSSATQGAKQITQGAQNVQTPSTDLGTSIKNLLTGNSSLGVPGQLASLAGIASLLNNTLGGNASNSAYKGYQGGIPTLQASRQQYAIPQQQVGNYSANLPSTATSAQQANAVTPNQFANYIQNAGSNVTHAQIADQMNKYGITPQQAAKAVGADPTIVQQAYNTAMGPNAQLSPNYRPGQGGITYFSPMVYQPTSQLATAPTSTSTPTPTPTPTTATTPVDPATYGGTLTAASGGMMGYATGGGISSLGTYSDGGRMLRGPGDGVSDSIPATIGGHQKAALADGEFVIPARIVSEIGNGSSDAGARKLYAMMEKIQQARKKTTKNVAADTKAEKYLPA